MSFTPKTYIKLKASIGKEVTLLAVSKTQSIQDIMMLYEVGCRDFGENRVSELQEKYDALPKDIRWHFIGHLQTNKVKQIATCVALIHSVDRINLIKEINKQGRRLGKVIPCLIQLKIAQEDTKHGASVGEIKELLNYPAEYIAWQGMMGMATNTIDESLIRKEFNQLHSVFSIYASERFKYLSMGMSNDYRVAIDLGSNMIRIGSLLFN